MLRSNKDALYDNDGLIIFNALDLILSISLDKFSGMLSCQTWAQHSKVGLTHEKYTDINVLVSQ